MTGSRPSPVVGQFLMVGCESKGLVPVRLNGKWRSWWRSQELRVGTNALTSALRSSAVEFERRRLELGVE